MTQPAWNPMRQAFDRPPTLAEFLLARWDEDEEVAAAAAGEVAAEWHAFEYPYEGIGVSPGLPPEGFTLGQEYTTATTEQITRWSPARVRADLAAKRRIVTAHSGLAPYCAWSQDPNGPHGDDPCETLRLLAEPYADYLDYQEAWRV